MAQEPGRPPAFGVPVEQFLADRGLVPDPLQPLAPTAPRRRGAQRPVPDDAPVDLRPRDRQGGSRRAGKGPRAWPTREERDEARQAKEQALAAEVAADPVGTARDLCLRLLEHGPRTRSELAGALARRGVPSDAAEQVLGRFTDVGMIDDELFATLWVASRHRSRGLAGRALTQELRRKGVDDELVQAAVSGLDPEQELETARRLVRRKLATTRGLPPEARLRRATGLLARKGYGAGTAYRVVAQELQAEGSDPPEEGFDVIEALDD